MGEVEAGRALEFQWMLHGWCLAAHDLNVAPILVRKVFLLIIFRGAVVQLLGD